MRRFSRPASVLSASVLAGVISIVGMAALGNYLHLASAAVEPNDEIHSSFGDDSSQMWLYWHGPDATVSYGTSTAYSQTETAQAPTIKPIDQSGQFWQVKLTGLTAGTTYHYQIGTSGVDHTFQTAPTSDFVWDDLGDTGSTYYDASTPSSCNKYWMSDVWQQIAADHPAFVTHGGDITYANECGVPAIHQFWNDIMPVSTQAAFQFSWGNHEYGPKSSTAPAGTPSNDSMANYKGRYNMSNSQTVPVDTATRVKNPGCPSPTNSSQNGCQGDDWGSFTAGHVLFISYPEPWVNAYADWQTKADALMAQAEADPNIYFIVTYGHRPAYSSLTTNAAPADLQAAVNALGDKYSPSARPDGKYVLTVGHHIHGAEVFKPQHGVVSMTDGGGGTELTSIKTPAANSVWHTNHFEHMRTTVIGTSMKVEFICGPVYPLNTAKDPCTKDSVIYTQTLKGYQAGPANSNLKTSLSDGVNSAMLGDTLTYTAQAQNTQAGTSASGVNLTLQLPANVTITDNGGGIVSGNSISWPLGYVGGGQTMTKTVKAHLDSGAAGSQYTATLTADATDQSCQNVDSSCTATDTDQVGQLATSTEFILNPSVESDLSGWVVYNSSTQLARTTSGAQAGNASLQSTRTASTSGPAGFSAKPRPVLSTTPGAVYTAKVWVKPERVGQSVTLLLKEGTATSKTSYTFQDTAWHELSVSRTATGGNVLIYNVFGTNIAQNDWFLADSMSLTTP